MVVCGVAQLVGDLGGVVEVVVDGEIGLVVRYFDDIEVVVVALVCLVDDFEGRVVMGVAAWARVVVLFDYDVLVV